MKRILVIDDAEFILESTSTLLRFEGYEVFTASDGANGCEIAVNTLPDLILCDISMPGLDGYGVLEILRQHPLTATTPFIFLTAFTEKSNMRAGMEKGADDFIVKPYTRDELIAAIDAQWNKHSLIEKQVKEKVEEVGKSVTYALPHEFRTVLNEVINSAKYLNNAADSVEPQEIIELTNDIITSSNRLIKITENFLIYVRIQSMSSNINLKKQLRTYRIAEPSDVFEDMAITKAEKFNRIDDLVIGETVNMISLEASSENFHIIIDELLDNAFKFSNKETEVRIKSWKKNNFVYFYIQDNGRGMDKEQLKNISALAQFERNIYEQQGIGLGLIIAKKMVELHDGEFVIESKENTGTTIIFSFPFIESGY
jgi:two-component system, sensor histidine kinase and response regulator